jgi:protein-disulfide isomerase
MIMHEEWWERPICIVCDYWWAFLLAILLGLFAFFARNLWLQSGAPSAIPIAISSPVLPTTPTSTLSTTTATTAVFISTATVTATPVVTFPSISRVNVSTDNDPAIGLENAAITIIEFSDYQCGYCQRWQQQVYDKLMANYPGKIHFVYRDFPLPMHPEAIPAAEAANCAEEQDAYWKYHDALFSGQYSLGRVAYKQYAGDLRLDVVAFTACLDDHRYRAEVDADASDAARLGLTGTPSFYVNGRLIIGALPYEDFKNIIDEELALNQ